MTANGTTDYQRGWSDAIAAIRDALPGLRMHYVDLGDGHADFALEEGILDRVLDNVLEDGVPGSVQYETLTIEADR